MTLNEWILFGDVGLSSKTMWAVVTGTVNDRNIKKFCANIPCDKSDFGRCYALWKECNLTDSDLNKIKDIFPIWKPFIDNWYELVRMYESNEKMYKYMSKLVEKGRLNLNDNLDKCNKMEFYNNITSFCNCKGGAKGRTVTEDFEHQICDVCGNTTK